MSHIFDADNINNDFEMNHNTQCIQNETVHVISSPIGTDDGDNKQFVTTQYNICSQNLL